MVKVWKIILAAAIIIVSLKVAYFNVNSNNYYWDEAVYLDIANNIHQNGSYSSSLGEDFRAPLFPALLSLFTDLTAAHMLVITLCLLSIALAFLLGKEILNERAGAVAALLLAINPLYNFWSFKLVTEPLAICLILASLYFFVRYEKKKENSYLYLAFFSAGLSTLSRYTGLSLIAALALAVLVKSRRLERNHILAALALLAALTPIFVLGIQHYGNPLGMLLQNSAETAYPKMPISNYFQDALYSLGYMAPLLFVIALASKQRKKIPLVFFLYMLTTASMLAVVSQKYQRFLIILLPVYVVIASAGFLHIYSKSGKLKLVIIAALLVIASFTAYFNIQDIKIESHNTEILMDATRFVKDLDCTTAITNSTKHFSYFSGKQTEGYPASQEEFLELENKSESPCLVVDNFHGTPPYRKFINDTYELVYTNSSKNRFVYVYLT